MRGDGGFDGEGKDRGEREVESLLKRPPASPQPPPPPPQPLPASVPPTTANLSILPPPRLQVLRHRTVLPSPSEGYKMLHPQLWVLFLSILHFPLSLHASEDLNSLDTRVKSSVYLSPSFFLRPGSVMEKFYLDIPFPKGHIAFKSFNAEIVDEKGTPIPLYETYLHHFVLIPYYREKGVTDPREVIAGELSLLNINFKTNDGVCNNGNRHYYGQGAETRKTSTWVPGNYGIEVAKPEDVPEGHEERWLLNVHAIDVRGAEDRLGCTECRCSLYNVTVGMNGQPLEEDYTGGFDCCYDQVQCLVRQGFNEVGRKLYFRYTVRWVDWDDSIVPVKIYIIDTAGYNSTEQTCKFEYQVKPCSLQSRGSGECVDVRKIEAAIPRGGDIVYGVAHQHIGGLGSALYGQDGRVLCTSTPIYGEGKEAGNEAGYVVGMSSCYPEPGSVRIKDGELLTLVSNYSNSQQHSGVMGSFSIMVAEPQEKQDVMSGHNIPFAWGVESPNHSRVFLLIAGLAAVIVGLFYRSRGHADEGYQALVVA